jgi:hypothetical protein
MRSSSSPSGSATIRPGHMKRIKEGEDFFEACLAKAVANCRSRAGHVITVAQCYLKGVCHADSRRRQGARRS